ncbi:DUF4062 domain-containing protein [Flavobacterium anhuiense]|uniref:DUF4062 domain-containing protein n=1 Tax=Flavobacterium anhuiense TaxID=459526 RepID=UPI000E6CFA0F|nr:DUF4062 domain-containing protein [Flavobacterium anhuiense]
MAKKTLIPKLKVMVASTIFGYEDQLEQICATLRGYNYEVWNSHMKTIPVNPLLSNTENCLHAVANCDLFFGILRPRYGAVPDGDLSITHQEMRLAIALNKPRWFVAHRDISVARQLLKQYMFLEKNKVNDEFKYRSTAIMDDIRLIQQYNDIILDHIDPASRIGHWTDEFFRVGDVLRVIETQLQDQLRVKQIVEQMNKKE